MLRALVKEDAQPEVIESLIREEYGKLSTLSLGHPDAAQHGLRADALGREHLR